MIVFSLFASGMITPWFFAPFKKNDTINSHFGRGGREVRAWFQWKRIPFMRFFLWRREEELWISFTLPGSVLPVTVKDLSAWHVHKVYLHPTAMKTSITVFYVNRNKVTLKCFGISFFNTTRQIAGWWKTVLLSVKESIGNFFFFHQRARKKKTHLTLESDKIVASNFSLY